MASKVTLTELVDSYLARRAGRLARSTWNSERSCLMRLARWWDDRPNRKLPKSMTEADLSGYLWDRHRCGKGCGGSGRWHAGPGLRDSYSDGKFNGDLSRLRHFLEWAVRYGHVQPELLEPVDKSQNVRLRRKRRLQLTPDQLGEMIHEAPDPWTRAVCALAVFTAGRASELLTLRVGDVDLEGGAIDWSRHKTGDDGDQLPITSDLSDELELWLKVYDAEAGPLRPNHYLIPRRSPVHTPGQVYRWRYEPEKRRGGNLHKVIKPELSRVLRVPESELTQEGVHTLRRSMARALYERLRAENHPDPIAVVQALLGHAQRAMTERYIGVESSRRERDQLLRGRSMFGKEQSRG